MINKGTITVTSLIAVVAVFFLNSFSSYSGTNTSGAKKEINWMSFEKALKKNRKNPKMIVIDVYTDWCGYCKKMDKNTFQNEKVIKYVNKNFYPVKLDAESGNKFTYKDKEYSSKSLVKKVFRVRGYPTTVYLDGDNEILSVVPGYHSANKFKLLSRYFAEEHYEETNWKDFKAKHTNN